MPTKLEEAQGLLEQKQRELMEIFEQNQKGGEYDFTPEQLDEIRARNAELEELGKRVDELREIDEIHQKTRQAIREANAPAHHLPLATEPVIAQPQRAKSLGELFTEHERYKNWTPGQDLFMQIQEWDAKTLMTTTAGFAPENLRIDRVIESAQRRPMIQSLIPQTTTSQGAIVYMEETTFTNAAAATAEGGTYPESALAYTERSDAVRKVSTLLPVTDEQLDDVPQIQSLINNRLTLMLMLAEESQILTGSGVAPNLTGFANKSGVQTQAKGADPTPDAIYKGMTKVRHTGFADVTGVVMHPNDWQDIRLLKDSNGNYIWGNPAEAGPERIWGVAVVQTIAQTENTALLGDFALFSELFRRKGIEIKVTDSHSTYFAEGKQAIRADLRVALAIYRAAAFCNVTGI